MEFLMQYKKWFYIGGAVILIVFSLFFYSRVSGQKDEFNEIDPISNPTPSPASEIPKEAPKIPKAEEVHQSLTIMVDVEGSVKKPGVYKMNDGERVYDAIQHAGGFLSEANVHSVNQAQRIQDEMVIYVAENGEEIQPVNQVSSQERSEKININTATSSELELLDGVGPSKAASIVEYRKKNGSFTSIEDLLEIRGIGDKTIEQWKDKISF